MKEKEKIKTSNNSRYTYDKKLDDRKGNNEFLTANIPIVIGQFDLRINVESAFDMPYTVSDIKEISNEITITNCVVLNDKNKLLLSGIINKKVRYYTSTLSEVVGAFGKMKRMNVNIPFSCTTKVNFKGVQPKKVYKSTTYEITYREENDSLNGYSSSKGFISLNDYRNPPYCEISNIKIYDNNENICKSVIYEDRCPLGVKEIIKVENSIIISMRVEILDRRDIIIKNS